LLAVSRVGFVAEYGDWSPRISSNSIAFGQVQLFDGATVVFRWFPWDDSRLVDDFAANKELAMDASIDGDLASV
jgi:hypothetical protein